MKIKLLVLISMCSFSLTGWSQTATAPQFITKGKIEFEKKTNQHAFLDDNDSWDAGLKKTLPKFVTSYYNLEFNKDHSIYKQGREPETRQNRFWGMFDIDNIIATDLDSNKSVTQKSIYGDTYLITDSTRKIDWKIGTEIRKIAGFDCRKAVGKVLDSIIVIAFYTDEIIPSGGPESFTGLPGMILGIAIPKMHTTWYATKLQLEEVISSALALPKKGKKVSGESYRSQVTDLLKNQGDWAIRMRWQLML
jgi:GLPGLI family protein